ncbi:hypothetical protein BTVI_46232 [Pitangus sulphuratus]|nr:hypothetical protein BTVI_46232 [Pitangus sulphuratus]
MDLPLAKAKPISDSSNAFVITYLRRKCYYEEGIAAREEFNESFIREGYAGANETGGCYIMELTTHMAH